MVANPGDFEVRLLLTQVLLDSGRQADAENELRQAVELSKNDPVRWITLVKVLAETKQPDKAEKAFKEAKTNLAPLTEPTPSLAFAECCELVGRAYESVGSADAVKTWYGEAKSWLEKAQRAQPNNLSITRRFTQFLLQTKQSNEAESLLEAILNRGSSDNKTADEVAWARRALALTRIAKGDPEQARKALALFDATDQTGATNKALEEAEDARALARVLEAQKTPEHRKRAIEIMNSLVGKSPNNFDDRLLLAQLYEVAGDWPKAREQYDELITRSEKQEDPATRIRRPAYFDQFIKSLIRHRQGSENQELTKAQDLVDKLKRLQPDDLNPLVLEVMINRAQSEFEKSAALKLTQNPLEEEAARKRAQNYLDKATGLIQAFANRPNLTPAKLATLADQAERLNELDLAEKLLRQIWDKSRTPRVTMALAAFYGRQGRVKPALDLCAPLWPISSDLEVLAVVCLEVVLRPSNDPEPADLQRVISWLTQALNQARPSTTLMVFLANLQDRHGDYQEAEKLYRRALERGDPNWMSLNNLAWLLALQDGGNKKDALEYINRAIDLKGPLPDFLDTRGIVYLAAGENQRAITDLEKAVADDPSPPKYFHLAEAYLKANKVEEAKKNWRAANIKQLQKSGLHPLEQKTYNKVRSELGPP
jgi:tetratricopeptide (TPR) repeat protein